MLSGVNFVLSEKCLVLKGLTEFLKTDLRLICTVNHIFNFIGGFKECFHYIP